MRSFTSRATGLPVNWVNSTTGDGDVRCASSAGGCVANAQRPLPGRERWTGPSCYGIYYAVGPAAEFKDAWLKLDAHQAVVISDKEIMGALIKETVRRGFGKERLLNFEPYQLVELASLWLSMPLNEAYLSESVADRLNELFEEKDPFDAVADVAEEES